MGKCSEIRVIAAVLAICGAGPVAADCVPGQIELAGDFGRAAFQVDVVDTYETRAQGLMFVEEMPEDTGMLFVYDRPQTVAFWMQNTLIPLDMIFIDRRGVVKKVHSNAVPHDRTAIPSGAPVLSVLEINGGLAEQIGIEPGTLVRHEDLPQDGVAWPC